MGTELLGPVRCTCSVLPVSFDSIHSTGITGDLVGGTSHTYVPAVMVSVEIGYRSDVSSKREETGLWAAERKLPGSCGLGARN